MTYIEHIASPSARRPSLVQRVTQAYAIWRQRQALRHLDDAALDDIGITRAEALTEARRSVWDMPACPRS